MEAFAAAGGAGAAIAIELVDGEHAVSAVAALGEGGAALRPAAKRRVSPCPEIHLRADDDARRHGRGVERHAAR